MLSISNLRRYKQASLEERDAAEVRWITRHTKALELLQAGDPAAGRCKLED